MNIVPNSQRVDYIRFSPAFSVMACKLGHAPFYGTIEIEYRPTDKLLEFISAEDCIKQFGTMMLTIEDVARLAFDEAARALGDIPLRVTVNARTTVHAPVTAQIKQGDWST